MSTHEHRAGHRSVGGEGMTRRLTLAGHSFRGGREVARAAISGDLDAIQEIRNCGRALGEVLSGDVNFFNPEVIVVGGVVAQAHEQLITWMREVIYQRCLPLALTDLQIEPAGLGDDAGIIGAAAMTIDHVMSPGAVDRMLIPKMELPAAVSRQRCEHSTKIQVVLEQGTILVGNQCREGEGVKLGSNR